MTPELHWPAIVVRLILTLLAGALLGFDRSRNGHPAGLRTVLLVTLAASVAMIQMDLLLPTSGKTPVSFGVMDMMRLPLGILTGVGFIGAGAIVRKGNMVLGVTTAATLWFATVVGLCLGGGQEVLGCVAALLGYFVLAALRLLERRFERYQPATLTLIAGENALLPDNLRARLQAANFRVRSISIAYSREERRQRIRCQVRWPATSGADVPPVVKDLEQTPGLIQIAWRAGDTGPN
ncbi:MAG TPA: MgtC/SapB family protein [Terracidiphilus sp.]|nr:MgtC/SapB family protein [Terracidiphilus sp.]